MPQYADPDNGQGGQATSPCNVQSDKMVEAFEEQQTQQNTAFAQSMDAIERNAKSAHAARELDVEETLLQITIKYDAADQQRHAQWRRAEQEMRETSSARENWRFEAVQQQERTRHTIALGALEESAAKTRRTVAQLDALEDGIAATLEDLRSRVDSAILSAGDSEHSTREPRVKYTLPSATLLSDWKRRRPWSSISDWDLNLPPLPEENDIQARALIETSSSEYDGTAAHGAEEAACPTVASSPPPKATNIAQMLQYMQQVFEQAESARVQQYARTQRYIDEYDEGFVPLFAALQRQLDRNLVEFVGGFMKLEAEQPTLLAAGSAISAFKAAEVARNAMYVNSMEFNTEDVKVIRQAKHALVLLERRLSVAGLVQSYVVARPASA
ncbi:hypothetical protein EXIGLDRAFT_778856 [Exidia glandulosa HHB12029]|uniref:Uncharacterized protein n=1 Tax=Exidia glandulosa HHB12029 TaxID=1314781 RepID=A0A165CC32_EXIGL|nr:hypothetical protein EXIGLDRAFT_778856 [Exidia glandulosa HHB12029]